MAIKEQHGSRTQDTTANGMTGTRVFWVDWDDRYSLPPTIGDPFPGEPALGATNISITVPDDIDVNAAGDGYTHAVVTVKYNTRDVNPLTDTLEFSAEALETGEGRTWLNASKANQADNPGAADFKAFNQSLSILYPQLEFTVNKYKNEIPWGAIFNSMGRVNARRMTIFDYNFNPETLLFLGASAKQEFTGRRRLLRGDLVFRYLMSYKFLFRNIGPTADGKRGHNVVWRSALPQRDANGRLKYEAGTDIIKMAGGIAGTADWDELVPPLYDTGNLQSLL